MQGGEYAQQYCLPVAWSYWHVPLQHDPLHRLVLPTGPFADTWCVRFWCQVALHCGLLRSARRDHKKVQWATGKPDQGAASQQACPPTSFFWTQTLVKPSQHLPEQCPAYELAPEHPQTPSVSDQVRKSRKPSTVIRCDDQALDQYAALRSCLSLLGLELLVHSTSVTDGHAAGGGIRTAELFAECLVVLARPIAARPAT